MTSIIAVRYSLSTREIRSSATRSQNGVNPRRSAMRTDTTRDLALERSALAEDRGQDRCYAGDRHHMREGMGIDRTGLGSRIPTACVDQGYPRMGLLEEARRNLSLDCRLIVPRLSGPIAVLFAHLRFTAPRPSGESLRAGATSETGTARSLPSKIARKSTIYGRAYRGAGAGYLGSDWVGANGCSGLDAPGSSATVQIDAGQTPTFSIFVQGTGVIDFDPAVNRIFVEFRDVTDAVRGKTSVAVRTQ